MTNNKTPLQEALIRMEKALSVYGEFEEAKIVLKAAQAYADLPSKIAMLKSDGIHSKIEYRRNVAHIKNDIINDILNLLKEGV